MINKQHYATIDAYISTFPEDVKGILKKIRQTIQKALPEAKEKIAYEIPTYEVSGKNLISFAGWKGYLSVYPVPAGDETFQKKIQPYKKAKSTLQFPLDAPIPYELIHQAAIFLKKEKIK